MRRIGALLLLAVVLGSCGGHEGDTPNGPEETIKGSVQTLNGRTYNCFRYTTTDRGGLWCERIEN